MRSRWKPWMGPVASALLLAVAFAGAWPLTFVALVPLLASLRDATPRQAWNRGYAFGLLFSLTQLWWLGSLAYVWIGSVALAVVPWLLASGLSAVYFGLLGRLVRSCQTLNALWAVPLVWAGMEAFRSYIPVLAFPWALLGEPLMAAPRLASPAWFGTVYLVSALVVMVNGVALKFARDGLHRSRWAVNELAIGLGLYVLCAFRSENGEPLARVAAGQPGVDNAFDRDARLKEAPALDALIARLPSKLDLFVLPEGVAEMGDGQSPPFQLPETPIVFGAQRGSGPVYQSAFGHDRKGWTVADKTRLVIFGEFVPGRTLFPFLGEAFHLPGGDLSAGDKLGTVRAGSLTVGPLICFEALFPDLGLRQAREGADLLAVMSIDDWFAPVARERLARAAQWRAVEAGLPLVRAGSLGRTMAVSSSGEVLGDVPYGGPALLQARLTRGRGPFPLVWAFPAVAVGSLVVVPLLARRRSRSV